MTYYTDNRSRRSGFLSGLTATVRTAAEDYSKWRLYRRTVSELSDLGDRELADLGLAPGDIDAAARRSVYG